ncbi:MAG: putative zinc-binding metallopeptidase [Acidobacteriota bacterium]
MDIIFEEKETTRAKTWEQERAQVLAQKISELPLKIEGTILESNIEHLYEEMEEKGLVFRPKCYLSDEWGCPDGIPIIGIPFYLTDKKLSRIEEEYTENLENEEEIIMYLRHEAGHAFNYAYELYKTDEWHSIFGPYSRPYIEDYKPNPLSKKYVKYSKGWYAQKHPDEDFAETFAVWLTPGLNWREQYAGWEALRKLEYVDRIAQELGQLQPRVAAMMEDRPVSDLKFTILEYYERHHSREFPKIVSQLGAYLDGDLREIFEPKKEDDWRPASEFIINHRVTLQNLVHYWTGTSIHLVRGLIRYLTERTEIAKIYYDPAKEQAYLMQLEAFLLTLTMNYRYTDRFVEI